MTADFIIAAIRFKTKKASGYNDIRKDFADSLDRLEDSVKSMKETKPSEYYAREWEEYYDQISGELPEYDEDVPLIDKIRADALDTIKELRKSIDSNEATFLYVTTRYSLFVSGGTSWGDSPTDAYDHIMRLICFPPRLLKKAGMN